MLRAALINWESQSLTPTLPVSLAVKEMQVFGRSSNGKLGIDQYLGATGNTKDNVLPIMQDAVDITFSAHQLHRLNASVGGEGSVIRIIGEMKVLRPNSNCRITSILADDWCQDGAAFFRDPKQVH